MVVVIVVTIIMVVVDGGYGYDSYIGGDGSCN